MRIGFLGLGTMGTPMALNLARKFPITVWNRSASKYPLLKQAGASIGNSPNQVLEQSDMVFSMLFDESAMKSIMTEDFKAALRGKMLINTSSVSVDFSQSLSKYVNEAGGTFVEMPVSGSKVPAEMGRLVGMIAGDKEAAGRIQPYVEPLTAAAIYCGPIGSGLRMKYAVNSYLISTTAALAESMNLARVQGLELEAFGKVLDAGQLASPYTKVKVPRMLEGDWSPQAAIKDCYNSTKLIQESGQIFGARAPLAQLCNELYKEAVDAGLDEDDMTAVYKLYSKQ